MAQETLVNRGQRIGIDLLHGGIGGGLVAAGSKVIEGAHHVPFFSPDMLHAIGSYGFVGGLMIAAYETVIRGILIDGGVPAFRIPRRSRKAE